MLTLLSTLQRLFIQPGLLKPTSLFCLLTKHENRRVTVLTQFCLICLVHATRANTRHFYNLTQTFSNHCRLPTPDKYLPLEVSLWGDGAQLSFFCSQRLIVHSGNYRALTAFISCNYTNKAAIGMVLHRSNWTSFSFLLFFLLFFAASSNRCNRAKKNISG